MNTVIETFLTTTALLFWLLVLPLALLFELTFEMVDATTALARMPRSLLL